MDVAKLFHPRHVAVVGASENHSVGKQVIDNFARVGYDGIVSAVNPKYETVAGYPCYPSLSAIPERPDAVAVVLGAERAVSAIEEAAELGIPAAVVFDGGFMEIKGIGVERQQRLERAAEKAGMAFLGPNCQGTLNFVDKCPLYLQFVEAYEPGRTALISQSGLVADVLSTNNRGVRWSHIVSCGNEAVVVAADLLEYFVDSPSVDVICMFLETIREPDRFFAQCQRANERGKPVIVLKSGRTEKARAAISAHTGALALPTRLVDGLMRRHGVISVDSVEELMSTAVLLQTGRLPSGGRVATLMGSGGVIELLLDASEKLSISYPEPLPVTKARLDEHLDPDVTAKNPLDYWPSKDVDTSYPRLLDALASDPNTDIVMAVINAGWYPTGSQRIGGREIEEMRNLAARTDKHLVILDITDGRMDGEMVDACRIDEVAAIGGLHAGLKSIDNLVWWSRLQDERAQIIEMHDPSGAHLPGDAISGQPALAMVETLGIAVVPSIAITDTTEIHALAEGLGYPLVVKVGDSNLLHKTEVGGVVIGLKDADETRAAAERLFDAGYQTLLIQPQLVGGVELILGLQSDPQLGMFVIVGLGGIWTETLDDVAVRPVGLLEGEAEEMLRGLQGFPLLSGARGRTAHALAPIISAIEHVDAFGQATRSSLTSLDINPLIVNGDSVVAVDALIVPQQGASPH
jgi:acetate---CoA ligase (ADP-forming)